MLLKDKTAIITGAASERGIGRATARLFAEHGARVALIDLAEQDPAAAAAELGDGHRGYVCDVSDRGQCIDTVAQAVETFGVVDILVNNAAVVQSSGIEDISAEDYELVLNVNLRGNFQMAQAVIGHMRPRKEGAIVAVSSIAGRRGGGLFGGPHYSASKAGIFGLTRAMARELAPDGIRVNAIAPGPIDNDFTKGLMDPYKPEIAKTIPMGRLGTSEDMAKACLFLASDLASYITGAIIDVNGGLHIH